MLRANNEAKTRRATASTVLGKAKVMSFEDLQKARADRAHKDAAKVHKRMAKPARKRKHIMSEAEMEPGVVVSSTKAPDAARGAAPPGEAITFIDADNSAPWRAPVAQMW